MYTEGILKYFAYYIVNKQYAVHYIRQHEFSKPVDIYISKQGDREPSIDKKVCFLISELKPAEPKYVINKLKRMENVTIDKKFLDNEEYVIFNINDNNASIDQRLLYYISNNGKFVYNYSNNNPVYKRKLKLRDIFDNTGK